MSPRPGQLAARYAARCCPTAPGSTSGPAGSPAPTRCSTGCGQASRGARSGGRCTTGWWTFPGCSASTPRTSSCPTRSWTEPRGARRALRRRARRAVRHRRPVPVPRRAGQRRLARRPDRPRQHRGHHGRDHLPRRARGRCCSAPARRRRRRSGTTLGHGDLLVMGGSCQRTWEHAVPKTTQAVGPRISVQFRPRGVR